MGIPLFHVGVVAFCPHQSGKIDTLPTNARVLVSKQAVAVVSDQFPIAGCPFTVPTGKPQPCIKVMWMRPATRVFANKTPVILADPSAGLCQSLEGVLQGPPGIKIVQQRVRGL